MCAFLNYPDAQCEQGKTPPPALRNISFEIAPGRVLGIVGPPGSGRTTIAHLIPRFYGVTSGRITIDGQDVCAVTLDSLRRCVNVVQQDLFLLYLRCCCQRCLWRPLG